MLEFFIPGLEEFSEIILADNKHHTFKADKAYEETRHDEQ